MAFMGPGIIITFTCLQVLVIYPLATKALKIWHRWVMKTSTPCCKRAGKIPSFPADLNGLNVFITHLILDWLMFFLQISQSSLWAANANGFSCPFHSTVISSTSDTGKWTLYIPQDLFSRLHISYRFHPVRQTGHDPHESGPIKNILYPLTVVSPK